MKSKREKLYEIIYEAETPAGKLFDIVLLLAIIFSVLSVILESVSSIEGDYGEKLRAAEWFFTILFTAEYALRVICIRKPTSYIFSFYGLVDILSIIPTYLSLYITGSQSLAVIRAIRLLRIFRILKLMRFLGEAAVLWKGLRSSLPKITVFLGAVASLALVAGTLMYIVEGPEHGFTSIPKSFYWAIVTLTTVGYGDVIPQTIAGQSIATVLMVLGYGVIAVPAGIVSVQIAEATKAMPDARTCPGCAAEGLGEDSDFCSFCGERLHVHE